MFVAHRCRFACRNKYSPCSHTGDHAYNRASCCQLFVPAFSSSRAPSAPFRSSVKPSRASSFTITDAGFFDVNDIVHGRWTVVAGSGTGELTGLRGAGEFTVATFDGVLRSIYVIDCWFENDDDPAGPPGPESVRPI